MLCRNLLTLGFAAVALALPYQQTQSQVAALHSSQEEPAADPLFANIQELNDGIKELNKVYASFTGRAEEALGLEAMSDKLYKTMGSMIDKVNAHKEFTLLEAANIGTAFLDFIPNSVTAIDSLITKKTYFEQLGAVPVIVQELKKQRDQAEALEKAMDSKVPEIGRDTAKEIYGDVKASFDKAIASFSANNAAEYGAGTEASAEDLVPSR